MALLCVLGGVVPGAAQAQDQVRDFTQPILVLNTGGHHAPIRSLIFVPGGNQLLSGGLDKVINVWGGIQAARPTLDATLRPPIWRGPAGWIYAMALSPTADEHDQRVLAVAGYGVESRRGNIGLFRFPGSPAIKTGDHFAELLKDNPDDPLPTGHTDSVTSLAFDPLGSLLASGSNDSTARVWDWKNRRTVAILRGHAGAINALAFTPDGKRLITGGRDGTLRLWDISRPEAPVATAPPPARNDEDPLGIQINTLAVSGDGRWVVIGREDGRVIRYAAADLADEHVLPSKSETIESLALSHAGTRLVTSSIARLRTRSELPRLACSIDVRDFPDGGNRREIRKLDNIAYALAFSQDDRTLAVAGGDRQGIHLITNWERAPVAAPELRGQGWSVWDVGLGERDGRLAVGFSHVPDDHLLYAHPQGAAAKRPYRGMILPNREIISIDPVELSRGVLEFEGWTIRPIDQLHLEVARANPPGRKFQIALDEQKDRRWKCYSFIPPSPKHPRATVAVGCDAGIWFYRLEDGQPTRLFSGHSGAVYCLAPSKDGRWLATGSSDQTVRLWTLAGCDSVPTLGVEFERLPDGTRVVKAVEPLGFGEAMGLRKGDVPRFFAIGGMVVTADDFFARFEAQIPNTAIEIIVRRKAEPPQGQGQGPPDGEEVKLYSTKRDRPALSLFMGEDREWVLWMPSGYYDTSIAGDTKFLGWHLNQATIEQPKPTDYLEIIRFEKKMRQHWRVQPNKLDTLIETGEMALALAVVEPLPEPVVPAPANPPQPPALSPSEIVALGQPPKIVPWAQPMPNQQITTLEGKTIDLREALPEKVAFGGLGADGKGTLRLRLLVDAEGRSLARSLDYRLDGRLIRPSKVFDRPVAQYEETVDLSLFPGSHRVTWEVENELGIRRSTSRDLVVQGLARPRTTRLKVLTIAPAFQEKLIPPIPFADRDIKDLKKFFARYLVSPTDGRPLYPLEDDALDGASATTERVKKAFEALQGELLEEGDLVVVVVESHFINVGRERKIVAANGKGIPPDPAIPADELARRLGDVAKHRCKVVVLLDGVHTASNKVWDTDVNDWVRQLRDEHNVITFVASNSGVSQVLVDQGHRAFTQAVLDSIKPSLRNGSIYLLNDFRDIVIEGVLNLTGRQQQAACYVPETINGQFPILNPRAARR